MENTPATLKISEKARKYHFFPRKSMLVLRKNSTGFPSPFSIYDLKDHDLAVNLPNFLNAERFPALLAIQTKIEDEARDEYCREQVRQQAENQGSSESAHRTRSEDEQNCGRNDGRDVRINNGDPSVAETLIHGRR